jgi:DHA2 family multidrug resistance protein-like MFS transporter
LLLAAGVGLARLIRRENPKVAPLIPLDLLRVRQLRLAVGASVLCFTGQTAGLVALPFYLQHELGQGVLATGFYMTAWPLAVAFAAPVVGRLSSRVSANLLCAAGGMLLAIGLGTAAVWPLQHNPAPLLLFTMFCGVGFGLFNVPNNRTMFLQAPLARSGAAGGMQGTARLLGQTAGAVMMTLLFTLAAPNMAPRIGLALGAVLTLAAGAVSMLRRESTAH